VRYLENRSSVQQLRAMTSMREEDIPGVSLRGRKPEQLTVPELKLWLTCRGAPTKGKKADLVER
jgi:hypothetical protein